jgi:hypothetical protein
LSPLLLLTDCPSLLLLVGVTVLIEVIMGSSPASKPRLSMTGVASSKSILPVKVSLRKNSTLLLNYLFCEAPR